MRAEAIVIGAGPAGCTAARLLSSWGHSVLLLHRPDSKPVNLAESLPPSGRNAVHLADLEEVVRESSIGVCAGNVSWWGSGEPRQESYPAGRQGWHIDRHRFDNALRSRTPYVEAHVARVECMAGGYRVPWPGGAADAPYILDCSGRAGVVARHGLRRYTDSRTISISSRWRHEAPLPTGMAHTLVEAHRDGWAWAIPLSGATLAAGTMVDALHVRSRSGAPLEQAYRGAIDRTAAFRELLEGASIDGPVTACDASTYDCVRAIDGGLLLVGDAASFVDPISSFGLKKALTSAWLGAVAVHTSLTDSSRSRLALEYFAARERRSHSDLQRQAQRYFQVAAARIPGPFWEKRADVGPEDALYEPARLIEELERMRAAREVRLARSPRLERGEKPGVFGNEIKSITGWRHPNWPPHLEFVCGVELKDLVELVDTYEEPGVLYEAYRQQHNPDLDPPNFLGAVCLLVAKGILVYR